MRFFKEWGWTLWLVFVVLIIIGSIWFRVAAPCSWMGTLPAKDIPGRCLTFVKH